MAQGLRVEQAVSKPVVRSVPEFEVSGIGLAAPAQTASASLPASLAAPALKPGTPDSVTLPVAARPLENGMWIFLSGIAAILAAITYAIWRKRKRMV
jgi:hypothetical protein